MQGYPVICQHVPLRTFVGLSIEPPETGQADWCLSALPEDHLGYTSISDSFEQVRWRTLADTADDSPYGDRVDDFLHKLQKRRSPVSRALSANTRDALDPIRLLRIRVLTLNEVARGSVNWSGAMAAALAGALFVAACNVDSNGHWGGERIYAAGVPLQSEAFVWELALMLEVAFQGGPPAESYSYPLASGWGPYCSIVARESPILYHRALYPEVGRAVPTRAISNLSKDSNQPYPALGERAVPRGCAVGIVRTARVRDVRTHDAEEMREHENHSIYPPVELITFLESVLSKRPRSPACKELLNILAAVGSLSASHGSTLPQAVDMSYATIALLTLNVWEALEALLEPVSKVTAVDTTRSSSLRTRSRLLASAMSKIQATLVALGRDWFEGDVAVAEFSRVAHRYGISPESAIKMHGWGRGGSLVYVVPTRWDDSQVISFLEEFRQATETAAQGPLAFEWCSLEGNDGRGVQVEKPFETRARILLGTKTSSTVMSGSAKVYLRLGGHDASTNASIEVFGSSGTGKSRFIEGLVERYADWGANVVWVWSKDSPRERLFGKHRSERVELGRDAGLVRSTSVEGLLASLADSAATSTRNALEPRVCAELGENYWKGLAAAAGRLYDLLPSDGSESSVAIYLIDLTAYLTDAERTAATAFIFTFLQLAFRHHSEDVQRQIYARVLPVEDTRGAQSDRDIPKLVLVNDEAHRIGQLASLDRILREGRSAGLATVLASQELRDLDELAHADTIVCFRMDPASAKTLAEIMENTEKGQKELATELRTLVYGRPMIFYGGGWRERVTAPW
jgi:hypothetical protein